MGKRLFFFELGGIHRIEVSWRDHWSAINIELDGVNIGEFYNKDALLTPYDYYLNNDTTLSFQMVPRFKDYKLQVSSNRLEIVHLSRSPEESVAVVCFSIHFLFVFNLLFGILPILLPSQNPHGTVFWIGYLVLCFFFLILEILILMKPSIAFVISIGVTVLDMLFFLVSLAYTELKFEWSVFLFFIMIIYLQFQGYAAIKLLQKKK